MKRQDELIEYCFRNGIDYTKDKHLRTLINNTPQHTFKVNNEWYFVVDVIEGSFSDDWEVWVAKLDIDSDSDFVTFKEQSLFEWLESEGYHMKEYNEFNYHTDENWHKQMLMPYEDVIEQAHDYKVMAQFLQAKYREFTKSDSILKGLFQLWAK